MKKRYLALNDYYITKYQQKVCKIPLDGPFDCPNKDGVKGIGGCIYCKSGSSSLLSSTKIDLIQQFYDVKTIMDKKWSNALYIPYLQSNTNTYAPVSELKKIYEPLIKLQDTLMLSIATRCDALGNDILNYLSELNVRKPLQVELGLQTIDPTTAKYINRCYTNEEFEKAVSELRLRKIEVVVHIINGLPYETKQMMLNTIIYLNKLDIQGIKIHSLLIQKNTKIAELYQKEKFPVLSLEEYVDITCTQLSLLRPDIVIHRLAADCQKEDLIAPLWPLKKFVVMNEIDKEMIKRDLYQGINFNQAKVNN